MKTEHTILLLAWIILVLLLINIWHIRASRVNIFDTPDNDQQVYTDGHSSTTLGELKRWIADSNKFCDVTNPVSILWMSNTPCYTSSAYISKIVKETGHLRPVMK